MNELYEYRNTRRLSVHAKVVLMGDLSINVGATILIFIFEYGNAKTLGAFIEHWKSIRLIVSSGYSEDSRCQYITNC